MGKSGHRRSFMDSFASLRQIATRTRSETLNVLFDNTEEIASVKPEGRKSPSTRISTVILETPKKVSKGKRLVHSDEVASKPRKLAPVDSDDSMPFTPMKPKKHHSKKGRRHHTPKKSKKPTSTSDSAIVLKNVLTPDVSTSARSSDYLVSKKLLFRKSTVIAPNNSASMLIDIESDDEIRDFNSVRAADLGRGSPLYYDLPVKHVEAKEMRSLFMPHLLIEQPSIEYRKNPKRSRIRESKNVNSPIDHVADESHEDFTIEWIPARVRILGRRFYSNIYVVNVCDFKEWPELIVGVNTFNRTYHVDIDSSPLSPRGNHECGHCAGFGVCMCALEKMLFEDYRYMRLYEHDYEALNNAFIREVNALHGRSRVIGNRSNNGNPVSCIKFPTRYENGKFTQEDPGGYLRSISAEQEIRKHSN